MRMSSQSLVDDAARGALIARLDDLRPDATRAWGSMDAAQMLAHCRTPLLVATGEIRLKRTLVGRLFGRLAKRMVLGPGDMKRNLPTDKEFVVTAARDFERERNELKQEMQRFVACARGGKLGDVHPFFGPMTLDDWDRIQWKHIDHHLRQFGA